MKTSSKRIALFLLASALTLLGGMGCRSTVNGVGRDVERVGHKIHRSVN